LRRLAPPGFWGDLERNRHQRESPCDDAGLEQELRA
jgi:hypothetical protein